MRILFSFLASLVLLVTFSATSYSDVIELTSTDSGLIEEVTALGTRLSTPEPQPTELIDSEQIIATQAATVAELIRFLPGITGVEPGGAGGVTEIFIRGADTNFTTVFINGILMNDPTDARGGGFDFSSISPVEINRIEVVRGPFSALYGSGALAGAINIDTRAPASERPGGLFQGSIGSDGYWQLGGSVYGPLASGHAGLNVNHVDYGEATLGSTRVISSINGNFNGSVGKAIGVDLTVRANQRDRTSYPVASGGPRLAVSPLLESSDAEEITIGASGDWTGERSTVSVSLSYLNRNELTDTPAIADGVFSGTPASRAETQFDRLMMTLQSSIKTAGGVELGAGLEYRDEQGESKGFLDFFWFELPADFKHKRRTLAPFFEGRVGIGTRVTTFAGLRYDDFSDSENAWSPRIGTVYEHSPQGTQLILTWGEGRKAASFFALGDPLVGNPELEPEDSSGWDISLAVPLSGDVLNLNLSAYQTRYTNLIDFDFSIFQLVNRTEVDTRGFEIQLSGTRGNVLRWQVSVATHKNDVDGEKNALLHRPELTAGAWLYWTPGEYWGFMFSVKHEGSRPSSSVPGGYETLESLTRFDLAASRMLAYRLELQLAIDNLFDKDYEAVAGFPSPGRQFRFGLRRRF